jgi:hypothetical protein
MAIYNEQLLEAAGFLLRLALGQETVDSDGFAVDQ